MKISIVGTGYVGLVSGTCFAETGVNVSCVDIDVDKIKALKRGEIPIYEPGLESLVKSNIDNGRLSFTTDIRESLVDADAVFIAVGTPPDEDGSADLKYVLSVASDIGNYITEHIVVVTKSTVPVGTSKKVYSTVAKALANRGVDTPFDVASNPEFLKEGNAIDDFLKPDRIVVGVESARARKVMERLYRPFVLNGHPIHVMDIPSAEVTKYAANAMLATKISFINDIASLCERVGADISNVRIGIGSDPRIGNKFIYPGTGYGGSCFPKDVKALIATSAKEGHTLKVLQAVEEVNELQKSILYRKAEAHFKGNLKGKHFAIWGLAFKPQTDDMREAPSLVLIEKLLAAGATVSVYDPVAMEECKRRIGDKVSYATSAHDTLVDADALFLVTEWSEFRVLDFRVISKLMNEKLIFDGRNIYDNEELAERGFSYYSIGRTPVLAKVEVSESVNV